jgi:hypothetical protein
MSDYSIPKDFYADENGKPFTNCIMCSIDLTNTGIPYAIEKSIRILDDGQKVTLYEMAICFSCGQKMQNQLSESSKKVMEKFFVELELPQKRMQLSETNWLDTWNKECLATNTPVEEIKEYNLMGNFMNSAFFHGIPPMLISSSLLEQLQEKISPETRREMDDFKEKFLGPRDPQLRQLLSETQFIFI